MQSDDVREVIKSYLYNNNNDLLGFWENKENLYENQYFKPLKFYIGDNTGKPLAMPISNRDEMFVHVVGKLRV